MRITKTTLISIFVFASLIVKAQKSQKPIEKEINSEKNKKKESNNTFVGTPSGFSNTTGDFNTFLGAYTGHRNTTGNANVFIGYQAGFNETGSNKLYISNSDTSNPLIYGDFSKRLLGINTNIIPDGYNFAVGGSVNISKNIDVNSATIGVSEIANSNWRRLQIGREIEAGRRNFNFVVSPNSETTEYIAFSIADKKKIARQNNYFRDNFSRISYKSNRNKHFFTLDHVDIEGQNRAAIQMPLANSKVVIAGYGDYLENQGHKFIVKDGTAMIENAIYTNGRIAIGTTADDPGYALTVKGKAHFQEVKIDLLGALVPDYVFYKNYNLKTLKEVENYIDQEGHLPNIPSASEMEAEGINLKEMNMKLLEKVEELTLYTIAQEKAIKEQEERLQKLEELLQK